MENETTLFNVDDWTLRVRPAHSSNNSRFLLLLHGLTGDENVMWVFTKKLPTDYTIVSPRAPYPTPRGGYSWTPDLKMDFSAFADSARRLKKLVEHLLSSEPDAIPPIDIMGFSQGAALAYVLALLYPNWTGKVAALSGFLPGGTEEHVSPGLLQGKPVLVTHGTQDSIVPFKESRRIMEVLQPTGAILTQCEEPGGHKLNAACNHQLVQFF